MRRVTDLKNYIIDRHPSLRSDLFEIAKVGNRIYIFLVTKDARIAREAIFLGPLPSVDGEPTLKKYLDANIDKVAKKYNYA